MIFTNLFLELYLENKQTSGLPASLDPDAWGMELVYGIGDQTLNSNYASGQNANYNGNITMLKSRTQGQSVTPTYGFMYDGLNRLTAGYYGERGTSTYSNLDRYTEVQTYDNNGNIAYLNRYGLAGGAAGVIDNLTYSYIGNQITSITESVANTTFRDKGFKYYSTGTYTYDAAGNLTNEPSKGAVITYNHLNLPRLFTLGSNTIEIEYDGGGNKLRKTVKQGSTTLYIQNYLGGIEYNSARLEAVFHAEGRVYNTNVGTGVSTLAFRYEYAIRDHLGNTRIMFTDKNDNGVLNVTAGTDNEIIQENHYYPFGMNQEGAWMNDAAAKDTKYQYNSKELNDDFGLNWNDYGARWYDAAIGRWNGVDPLAEKMSAWSTYNYAFDNPIRFVDPDGMAPYDDYFSAETGEYLGSDNKDSRNIKLVKGSNVKEVREIFKDKKVSNQEQEQLESSSHGPTYGELSDKSSENVINYYYEQLGYNLSELEGGSILVNGEYSNLAGTRNSKEDKGKLYIRVDDKSICTNCALRNGNDVMNMIVHERGGHGSDFLKGMKYDKNKNFWDWEKQATNLQINHSTWPKTSKGFKQVIWEAYGYEKYIVPENKRNQYFVKYGVGKN